MRVLVCGGRDFSDYALVAKTLDRYHASFWLELVIHGAAKGADALAARWAQEHCVPQLSHPANWERHGKSAGPIRNAQMLKKWEPRCVIAFPGGRGTAHMVRIAKEAGVTVVEIAPEPQSTVTASAPTRSANE